MSGTFDDLDWGNSTARHDVSARRVMVEVNMPHVEEFNRRYGGDRRPVLPLVYWWPGGPLKVGDSVLLPKMPHSDQEHVGVIVSLDDTSDYDGAVRTIVRRV